MAFDMKRNKGNKVCVVIEYGNMYEKVHVKSLSC